MAKLAKAPLIEAIFELRWGEILRDPTGTHIRFDFSSDDTDFFTGQFRSLAAAKGFPIAERVNSEIRMPGLPHVVTYRFRKAPNSWPCYQTGLGVFTANQVNEGYEWKTFKETILSGLEMLDQGHPKGLAHLPTIGVELRYQDGFLLEQNETPSSFLRKKLEIQFGVPSIFLDSPYLQGDLQGNSISFTVNLVRPKGILIIGLDQALINGEPGFVMNTVVRSADGKQPELKLKTLENWLENAHDVQRHAFNTLISPKYAKEFQ